MISAAPWMQYATAELGETERPGKENNPRILQYIASCKGGDKPWAAQDSTAHCSAFVNWCLLSAALPGTRSLAARSWLDYGQAVTPGDERYGDIVVFWRGLPLPASVRNAPGHVAFFTAMQTDGSLYVLGGNQNNRVSTAPYPRKRVIAVRRP